MRTLGSFIEDWQRDVRISCAPESGHFISYETTKVHWAREVTSQGDILYRRLSDSEVAALEHNDNLGNE